MAGGGYEVVVVVMKYCKSGVMEEERVVA